MLDPSLKWLGTLDYHYHDQSHFVRDFRRFMGMAPSAYARLDKPFMIAAARADDDRWGSDAGPSSSGGRQACLRLPHWHTAPQVLCKSRDLPLADARAQFASPIRQVMTELDAQKQAALAAIADAASLDALEEQRLAALGKKGWVSLALQDAWANEPGGTHCRRARDQSARAEIADAIETKKAALETAALEAQLARETIDLTLPTQAAPRGSVHPVGD